MFDSKKLRFDVAWRKSKFFLNKFSFQRKARWRRGESWYERDFFHFDLTLPQEPIFKLDEAAAFNAQTNAGTYASYVTVPACAATSQNILFSDQTLKQNYFETSENPLRNSNEHISHESESVFRLKLVDSTFQPVAKLSTCNSKQTSTLSFLNSNKHHVVATEEEKESCDSETYLPDKESYVTIDEALEQPKQAVNFVDSSARLLSNNNWNPNSFNDFSLVRINKSKSIKKISFIV